MQYQKRKDGRGDKEELGVHVIEYWTIVLISAFKKLMIYCTQWLNALMRRTQTHKHTHVI